MIWLAWHMWLLLLIMFALGMFFGWWLFGHYPRHRPHADPADTTPEQAPDRTAPSEPASLSRPVPAITTAERTPPVPVRPALYDTPDRGTPDNLQKISGVGPKYERLLNELGVYYYAQIISWSDGEIAWLDNRLGFPGRIHRDRWQEQARLLMLGAGLSAGSISESSS